MALQIAQWFRGSMNVCIINNNVRVCPHVKERVIKKEKR